MPALVLTPGSDGGRDSDGLLTTEEISQMAFDADRVLLSACNTAAAGASQDEWLSGLAASFLRAGARSVIVSHWPVPSQATVALTTRMIEVAEKVDDLAEAHRQAMLDISIQPGHSHPRYWAGFSLVGLGGG